MNPYIFEYNGYGIRWYSFLILIGAVLALILFIREGKRFGFDKDFLFNMAFWTIIIGFIGARAYYVAFNYKLYSNDLLSMFKIWEGGLAIHGGIIAGALTIFLYCKKYNVSLFRITDMAVPCLILAQAIGRWGNFFNGEAHGAVTTLEHLQSLHLPDFIIKGMNIGGFYYEPTFLYESILCLIGFIAIMIIRRLKYTKIGTVTSIYLMYYGVIRFFIEAMRDDSLIFFGFKAAQIISVIMFIFGLAMLMIISRKGRFEDLYNDMNKNTVNF